MHESPLSSFNEMAVFYETINDYLKKNMPTNYSATMKLGNGPVTLVPHAKNAAKKEKAAAAIHDFLVETTKRVGGLFDPSVLSDETGVYIDFLKNRKILYKNNTKKIERLFTKLYGETPPRYELLDEMIDMTKDALVQTKGNESEKREFRKTCKTIGRLEACMKKANDVIDRNLSEQKTVGLKGCATVFENGIVAVKKMTGGEEKEVPLAAWIFYMNMMMLDGVQNSVKQPHDLGLRIIDSIGGLEVITMRMLDVLKKDPALQTSPIATVLQEGKRRFDAIATLWGIQDVLQAEAVNACADANQVDAYRVDESVKRINGETGRCPMGFGRKAPH